VDPVELDGVTSAFGWRRDPINGATKFHKGVDLRAAYGEEVRAAADGKIEFAGIQGGYGQTVVVEHANGVRTRYAHLSATDVREGDTVAAGQPIGRAGKSGRATGTHLHFEVTAHGRAIDPQAWLTGSGIQG
jgi:murein DD-endopeptidase MepM/ murein hydrolase activator NlpD